MTAEQKKNREQAVLNLLYLYKKYYPVVEREMKKGQNNGSDSFSFGALLHFALEIQWCKYLGGAKNETGGLYLYSC